MRSVAEPDAVFFERPEDLEAWLGRHGESSDGVWVKMAKKHTGITSMDWTGAVEVALCFGWIDGQSRRIDDEWFMQRLTPRRPRSTWSKINREKVAALTAAGRMRPAGLAEVERAKADGRWDAAYDSPSRASVPEDLASALDDAGVRNAFAALDSQGRYAILHGVQTARKPETRARRIEKFVAMLVAGEKPRA
jgi:uncharacterized protein YdeI (YjbR/CyaY-like superfamily)